MNNTFFAIETISKDSLIKNPSLWVQNHGLNILIILGGAWIVQRLAASVIKTLLGRVMQGHSFSSDTDRKKRANTLHGLIDAMLRILIWAIASIMVIDELGINTAPLLASAGVFGVALGIGAQSFIKDFVSGMFIITENQYRVGDVVELDAGSPVSGTVEAITVRTTVLRDINGTQHHIPNGSIVVASNKTFGFSKINEMVVVDQNTNIEKLEKIINHVGDELAADETIGKLIKKTPRMDSVGGYNERGLFVYVRGDTTPGGQWTVKTELFKRLNSELTKAGIKIAMSPLTSPTKK
ncbi:MAG: mechanosensitive ion channel family protein [Candidatus Saccharibacteria bacterium]|nr:mechanosensitive ion channel family protein [Candidatus Saccharibacteria bacterium]